MTRSASCRLFLGSLLAVLIVAASAPSARATTLVVSEDACDLGSRSTIIRFEDRASGDMLDAQYRHRGVTFAGTAIVDAPSVGTRSGDHAAGSLRGDLGSAGHPIAMTFNKPMAAVALYVGRDLPSGRSLTPVHARLTAYGTNLYGVVSALMTAEVELPAESVAIDRCLVVIAPPGTTFGRATLEYSAYGNASAYDRRWLDDLTLLPGEANSAPVPSNSTEVLGAGAPPESPIESPAKSTGSDAWRWQVVLAAFGLALMLSCFVAWHWQKDGTVARRSSRFDDPGD